MLCTGAGRIARVFVRAAGKSDEARFTENGLPEEWGPNINVDGPASIVVTRGISDLRVNDRSELPAYVQAFSPITLLMPEIGVEVKMSEEQATMLAHALLGAAAKAGG